MAYGFYGRYLVCDLSSRRFSIEHLADDVLAAHLGAKGLATWLLLRHVPAGADPLGPENALIFATGPLTQSRAWGSSRYGVYCKSPLTGLYAESYSGGKTPEAVDAAGFDAVVIRGRAESPMALTIHPEGCTFHPADDLWGLEVYEAEDEALERFAPQGTGHGSPGAVVIGPAGENLVAFAIISNDYWRCAGRAGVGTVMGSKRLKAVVFGGDRQRELFKPDELADFSREFAARNREQPGVKAYKGYGTTQMVAIMNTAGAFPAKYWSQGTCAHWERLSGETFHTEHKITPHACRKCFMACGRMAEIAKGRHEGLRIEGPEYETIYAFGGLCMVEDIAEVAWLNDICDRLGMDTISAGNLCALVMEAASRGRLDYPIEYGDSDAITNLLRKIATREGIGEVLAKGIRHAAQALGLEDLAVHVKGMEPAGYDPRVLKGMGLSYAVSDRGACHLRTTFYKPELSGMIPPDTVEGKAELLTDFEDRLTLFDTLILCRFFRDMYDWKTLGQAIELATGLPGDKASLRRIAGRVTDLTRRFNLREGLTRADDRLPRRLVTEALPSGHALSAEEMGHMLRDYYRLRGWDEHGVPGTESS